VEERFRAGRFTFCITACARLHLLSSISLI